MWQKKESKLELAASMIHQVMPEFQEKKQVIILCDSWYTKQNLVSIVDEYQNLDPKRSLAFLAYRVISHVLRSSCVATAYRLIILRLERNKAGKRRGLRCYL